MNLQLPDTGGAVRPRLAGQAGPARRALVDRGRRSPRLALELRRPVAKLTVEIAAIGVAQLLSPLVCSP